MSAGPHPRKPSLTPSLPRVAVVLLQHGEYAKKFLVPCYESLCAQTYPMERFTLFIVDNASTPESQAYLRAMAPQARILPQKENGGWPGGNNAGIRLALQEEFDDVVLLNMDTKLDEEWLANLVQKAQNNPNLDILQSKILLYGTNRINSLGNRIQFLGYGYCNAYGQEESPRNHLPIDFASGASMLVKRRVFEKIGFLREEYFLYGEDLEFCWRARLAGFQVGMAEQSVCHHKYDVRNIIQAIFYVERNRLATLFTLEKWQTLTLILPALFLFEVGVLVYFTLRGRGRAMVQLVRYFLTPKTWKTILRYRKENQSLRVRKDYEIIKGFSGPIIFAEIKNPAFNILVNPLLWLYWSMVRIFIFW